MSLLEEAWAERYAHTDRLKGDLGVEYKGLGWYESKTDTLLVLESGERGILVVCWNRPNARSRVAAILSGLMGMDVFQVGG